MKNKPLPSYRPPSEGVDLNDITIKHERSDGEVLRMDKICQRYLNDLVAISEELKVTKSKSITFQQPIISAGETGIIYPNTITLIQGPAGAHKSRLAQGLCSLVIGKSSKIFLGYEFVYTKNIALCYLDTERNIRDQFPYALQQIQWNAGFRYSEHPPNFYYSSFIKILRTERLQALEDYVQYLRENAKGHLFIILDVISDLIADFNRVDESMRCIDWMNRMINEYDISFLAIIHENPGGEKARGHVGTELLNKVTTAIQIAPERDLEEEGIFRVAYKKNRNSHRMPFFNVRYSKQIRDLVVVQSEEVGDLRSNHVEKAPVSEVIPFLVECIPMEGVAGKDLIPLIMKKFDTTDKTVTQRLNVILELKKPITRADGKIYQLGKTRKGQGMWYSLQPQ